MAVYTGGDMKKKSEDRLSSNASGSIEQVQIVARFG